MWEKKVFDLAHKLEEILAFEKYLAYLALNRKVVLHLSDGLTLVYVHYLSSNPAGTDVYILNE